MFIFCEYLFSSKKILYTIYNSSSRYILFKILRASSQYLQPWCSKLFCSICKLISSHTNDKRKEKNDLELFLGWLTFEYDHPMTCSISAIWVEEWCDVRKSRRKKDEFFYWILVIKISARIGRLLHLDIMTSATQIYNSL